MSTASLASSASSTADIAPKKTRIGWVDYAKGICIFAVVMFHANLHVFEWTQTNSWLDYIVAFARPFRMPDFFLIAGLFLSNVINRPWRTYLDRKVVHFFYFYALWVTIYFVLYHVRFAVFSGETFGSPLWQQYLLLYLEPSGPIWFIHMLPIFFVVTRLLRPVPWWIVLTVAALLQSLPVDTGWGVADRFAQRFVFFYTGYIFAPYVFRLAAWAFDHAGKALALIVLWAPINAAIVFADWSLLPGVSLLLGYAGATAVVFSAVLFSKLDWMSWLRYLGEHSIAVYLAFLYPVEISLRLLLKSRVIDDVGTIALLVTLAGVAGAVVTYEIARRIGLRFLFERPAWARLTSRDAATPQQNHGAAHDADRQGVSLPAPARN